MSRRLKRYRRRWIAVATPVDVATRIAVARLVREAAGTTLPEPGHLIAQDANRPTEHRGVMP